MKNTSQTSVFAALDGTPLTLLTISCIKPGKEIEGIGKNCFAAKLQARVSNASGTRFLSGSRTKWLVNILLLMGPTIFEPSKSITSMHLITETTLCTF